MPAGLLSEAAVSGYHADNIAPALMGGFTLVRCCPPLGTHQLAPAHVAQMRLYLQPCCAEARPGFPAAHVCAVAVAARPGIICKVIVCKRFACSPLQHCSACLHTSMNSVGVRVCVCVYPFSPRDIRPRNCRGVRGRTISNCDASCPFGGRRMCCSVRLAVVRAPDSNSDRVHRMSNTAPLRLLPTSGEHRAYGRCHQGFGGMRKSLCPQER